MNSLKTALLLGALTALLVFIGGLIGGRSGMIIAFVLAAAMNFFSYWYSDRIVLRMYRARKIEPERAPELYNIVAGLAQNAGIPCPEIYVIDDPSPNAFATGRDKNHAVVAVTTGIVDILSTRELRGVLAHELGHVHNRDILIGSIAATLAGAVMILANMARFAMFFGGSGDDEDGGGMGMVGLLVVSIVAPLAALLVQMAVSRSREYLADRTGGEISGDPAALASALAKLEQASKTRPMARPRPETAHMFIVSPLSAGNLAGLFSTHPPIAERISRLQGMTGKGGGARQVDYSRPLMESLKTPPPPPPPSHPGAGNRGGTIDWS